MFSIGDTLYIVRGKNKGLKGTVSAFKVVRGGRAIVYTLKLPAPSREVIRVNSTDVVLAIYRSY